MYGNYGRAEDLDAVQKKSVALEGCVLLLRAGQISFAEQVFADLVRCWVARPNVGKRCERREDCSSNEQIKGKKNHGPLL